MDYKIIECIDQKTFRSWLAAHSTTTAGIWLRIYKKASGIDTVSYAEALDEALCYGWIDGQKKKYDELSFIQKFTPRRPRSLWSKRNIEHVARLIDAGQMTNTGMQEIQKAKADGRWNAAYDAPSTMEVPEDFLRELQKNPAAEARYRELNKSARYSIAWKLQTAKRAETRLRRMQQIIADLENNR